MFANLNLNILVQFSFFLFQLSFAFSGIRIHASRVCLFRLRLTSKLKFYLSCAVLSVTLDAVNKVFPIHHVNLSNLFLHTPVFKID